MFDQDELSENYAGAYNGHLVAGDNPALLLVDMVEAYLNPASPLYCETAAAAMEVAATLLECARANGRSVIFTNVTYKPGGADGGLFYRKVPVLRLFEIGSPLGAFPAALQPREGEMVIAKQFPSAFFGTRLTKYLSAIGTDTLVLGGYSTSGCVRASALDSLQNGFAPFIAKAACADRHPGPHESSLFDLQAKYAEVVDTETAQSILSESR